MKFVTIEFSITERRGRERERERNMSNHLISFKAYGVRSLSSLLHGVNAADHPDLKGCSNVLVLSSREKSS